MIFYLIIFTYWSTLWWLYWF